MILYFKCDDEYAIVSGTWDSFSIYYSDTEPFITVFPFYTLDDVLSTLDRNMWDEECDYEWYLENIDDLIIKKNGGYN